MRLAKCQGERCGATFPAAGRFCPRCGRAVDTIVPPPRWQEPRRPPTQRRRPRFPILRFIGLCWLVSFVISGLTHVAHRQAVTAPPAPVMVSPAPSVRVEAESAPDVSSFERFIAWRADHPSDAKHAGKRLEGQEIRWTGTLKKSLIPGRYELMGEMWRKESIHLVPVTADAKDDIRRVESGAHVQIEGVLMDERSAHVVSVREVSQP
jgi:hypothetical protein